MPNAARIALAASCAVAATASADYIEYRLGGTTDLVAVFGTVWDGAATGDPWELIVTVDNTKPEDDSTAGDHQRHRYFDSLVSATLRVGADSSPVSLFSDDLIFENLPAGDTIFFTGLETGGGTATIDVAAPPSFFSDSAFPTWFDAGAAAQATFDVNIFVNGEIGITGSGPGTISATLIPAPATLLLLAPLAARRRR